jgi:hypothetical protein
VLDPDGHNVEVVNHNSWPAVPGAGVAAPGRAGDRLRSS